jgi:thiamine-monophosphate kinase
MADVPLPEKKLIKRIKEMSGRTMPGIRAGIGDDCAILDPPRGHELLVTTDFSLEGTHFRREWHPPESVGNRCLARGLSDIAAMGGEPIAAFLSLALPKRLPQSWVNGFFRGFLALARLYKVTLAGGDISQADHILADVMVVGSAPKGAAIRRSGAKVSDVVYVTGSLGGAAAGLNNVSRGAFRVSRKASASSVRKHLYPEPRVAVGRWLREKKLATAMIDISDGLSTDLAHMCEESGVGAVVNELLLPVAPGASTVQALHGGEDYELLFTARPSARVPVEIAGVSVTEIGWITRERKVLISDLQRQPRKLEVKGWQYF